MNRRRFLRYAGATAVAVGASAIGLKSLKDFQNNEPVPPVTVTETTTNVVTPASIASLRAAAESRGLLVGAAAFPGPKPLNYYGGQGLLDRDYAGTLSSEFNFLTPEDVMDWSKIEMYGFGPADALVDFAIANRMKVRGHTLVYGYKNELPPRINEQMSSDQLRLAVQDHIRSEVGHFKGKVYDWTVVNEAVDNQDGLKQTIFLEELGEDYIAEAFKIAHEADPDALLIYNDYGAEAMNSDYNNKSDRVYALIKRLLAEGVPIGGVGLQMHIDAWNYPDPRLVAANVRRLADLGLKVFVTEMDVRISDLKGDLQSKLATQRRVYHDIISACVKERGFMGVTFWGFTDAYSWINNQFGPDKPLLFDEHYQPKPAYWGVMQALLGG